MSRIILIVGEPITGKSYSIKTLNPKETFILNVMDKQLPFKGSAKNYIHYHRDNTPNGNYFSTSNYSHIHALIGHVNHSMTHIKNFIIDDFQYLMFNEYVENAMVKGYDKYSIMASNIWKLIGSLSNYRSDLLFFIMSHSDENGSKIKTLGKMLDEKFSFAGAFECILHSVLIDEEYKFLTKREGDLIARSPSEMFEDKYIPNDLSYVKEKFELFENMEITADFNNFELNEL